MTSHEPRLPRGCSTLFGKPKKAFRTLAEAENHINGGPGMNAYYCRHCGNYHTGHLPGTKFGDRPPTSRQQLTRRIRQALRRWAT